MSNKETNKAIEEKLDEEVIVVELEEKSPCDCGCQECAESISAGGFIPEGEFQGIHPRLQKTLRPKNKKLTEADTK